MDMAAASLEVKNQIQLQAFASNDGDSPKSETEPDSSASSSLLASSSPGHTSHHSHHHHHQISKAAIAKRSGACSVEAAPMNRQDKLVTGSLKLVISEVSQLRHKMSTSIHYIGNLQWRLACKTECSKRTNNAKHFSVYVDCNSDWESTLWSCEAVVEFKLHSQSEKSPHFVRQFDNKFCYFSNNWGFPTFYSWSELVNGPYVKHDRLIIEGIVSIHKTRGIKANPRFDFVVPHPTSSSAILVVDGVRLHVSKEYLSLYSPVFQSLFYGDWREKGQEEILVEDVILDEFIEFLHVIYPSHKPVTAENVEYLLELGDKFEVNFVMEACENFLMKSDEITLMTKLVFSDLYEMAKLHDACVRSFKTPQEIKALRGNDEFKTLSDQTKSALLEKIFKLL